jgi:hypothetical protein
MTALHLVVLTSPALQPWLREQLHDEPHAWLSRVPCRSLFEGSAPEAAEALGRLFGVPLGAHTTITVLGDSAPLVWIVSVGALSLVIVAQVDGCASVYPIYAANTPRLPATFRRDWDPQEVQNEVDRLMVVHVRPTGASQ